jgi:soluble lytic murein transglycosylase
VQVRVFSIWWVMLFLLSGSAYAGNPEDDFPAARDAFRRGDIQRLDFYAARLKGDILEPFVTFLQLESRLKDADPGEIKAFISVNQDSHLSDRLRADWLRMLGKQEVWPLFLEEYPELVNRDNELVCYALQARLAQNDPTAYQDARAMWFTGNDQPASCLPVFDTLALRGALTVEDVWTRERLALEAGNVSVAKAVLMYLPQRSPLLGQALDRAADNPAAYLDNPLLDLKSREGREFAMFALYRLARSEPSQALPFWNAIRQQFPPEQQGYVWGQMAFQAARKHDPAALEWYANAGSAPLNEEERAWKVRAALRGRNWPLVLATIDTMPPREQSQGNWRYWKARALKALGKAGEANAILAPLSVEHNFYGQLATEELGSVIGSPAATYKASEEEIKAVGRIPAIRRALALYQMNIRYDANREWQWAIRDFDDKQLLAAAELARRNDWYDRAIYTAEKTTRLHDFSLRFPAPHRELMHDYASQVDLDEAWIYGLIRQESRFVQQARSGVGASGLMQLMPSTAKWVAKKLGMRGFRQSLINQLNVNLEFGTYYLKHVLDELDGQPVLATAAYNAGPRRANRWRGEGAMEGAIYAETIPFAETRGYVQKVMSNAVYYANRFGQRMTSLKQRLGTIAGTAGRPLCTGNGDERAPSCD